MVLPLILNEATDAHIRSLVADSAPEGPHLDLKRDAPKLDASGRHELLADVSAFANSAGGDLIFGVDEDGEGRAASVCAIAGNPDEEARRIQDSILNGIEPRLPGVQVKAVPVDGGFVLAVRVPQSWAGPHRVRTNQHFFVREGARKRQLDMPEVRSMFLRSEAQSQRVRDFRAERVGRVLAGDAPVKLIPGACVVVHLIPTQAALGLVAIDPVPYANEARLPGLGHEIPSARMNLDGALGIRLERQEGSRAYSLFFRNGYFEAVAALSWQKGDAAALPCVGYERELIALVTSFKSTLRQLGIGEELAVMWTLVHADQVSMGLGPREFFLKDEDHQGRFDRQVLAIPDVLIPADAAPGKALKPLFDYVWQSAGFTRCHNYNDAGEWAPPQA